ncbi:preprotein translocase subunit SecA [Reyranella sp.]|jgi:preprotein translocase subunit SecA|uniref:preprotein translocase subunit SecA n=1 Tax=Reyranella sp. TaxID=1929291 RepID=UPI000BC4DF12|nr:preprotein translocase subunit SecA [Reyranella sp.]OYY35171.1 MAG: preprotein translocase subunit SecA [Rhodospirillales bacterium 35-66-84]OYZ91220.1 MAG: preprotein translocase subunit SecA [Rhodospirillales bacterium 24-66-33]OZB21913.1 MAG: preprotein translocase subunit SecA [Rhodospirillales bacterium 39-66-50]HQS18999.1 preprotein translocase subunit SecA [Reyranella sp.]HQT15265.1 preprotein translocase subunit SecA [Reyranella sp.]
MLGALARTLFGTANDRIVKGFDKTVAKINGLEPEFVALSDEQLQGKTVEFRERLAKGETLDSLLPEAFATVREAAKRTLGQRHFDVQLKGGMVLHQGKIAEMKTGEGKTLVATLAVYLNALPGKGVHVVTVNDYLARRDAEWMGRVYTFLGLTVGIIVHELDDEQRKAAYACDITYGTNNEIGFDYLRDNMKYRLDAMAQRPFNHAIVDEVDSILIDEARTPLIISGPAEDSSELYRRADTVIPKLKPEHFEKDEKNRTVVLTDAGIEAVEEILRADGLLPEGISLYAPTMVSVLHHVTQALRAHKLFNRDVDYIVKDDQVVIIDEFTGRMMQGRRYSEGLHQALEAKEQVEIQRENQTLASITFQNLFRMYPKLSGMTGTALTEAAEFSEIYKLDVVEIPTNVPVARKDADDEIYRTQTDKTRAIVKLIGECRARQQPMLVGTVSIEKSEELSQALTTAGIPHHVLNARFHDQEAQIVAQAGRPGSVTIATNMAGRGTDIQLGGNVEMLVQQSVPEIIAKFPDEAARNAEIARVEAEIRAGVERDRAIVREAGGLFVVGTERHESRRIDNQLRGRSGRQGDPGASRFFLSLEDDLMRIFGNNKVLDWVQKKGMADDEALTHRWLNKALETAQGKVEARNFEIRKNLLRFDDVMNAQRQEIYKERIELMGTEDVSETVAGMRRDVVDTLVKRTIPEGVYAEQWKIGELKEEVQRIFGLDLPVDDWAKEEGIADEEIKTRLDDAVERVFAQKAAQYGPDVWRQVEKSVLMQIFDQSWKDHLLHLDHLRQGIGLRAYGQKDPLNEYKREAFNLFSDLLTNLREQVVTLLATLQIRMEPPPMPEMPSNMHEVHEDPALAASMSDDPAYDPADPDGGGVATLHRPRPVAKGPVDPNDPSTWGKVSRNSLCPCGSGKKFKHCHGRV